MLKHLKILEKHFGFVLIISAIVAFLIPQYFVWGKDLIDEMLIFAFFLSCLKLDFKEIFHLRENIGKMLLFVLTSIILFPLAFYLLSFTVSPSLRLGIFLIFGVSGAVMTPMLATFLRLKILWTTVFVVLTSLLVPFTLPLLIKYLFALNVELNVVEMSLFLGKIIFVPAILALIFRKILPRLTEKLIPTTGVLGSVNMAFFVAVIIAGNQQFLLEKLFHLSAIPVLLAVCFTFAFRFLLGYLLPASSNTERWTNSLMFGNINSGLVILLAAEFLSPDVLFVTLLSEIPWVLAQPIFQRLVWKYAKP